MHTLKRRYFLILLLFLVVFQPSPEGAIGTEVAREYQLKAAYLFNFARFVSWPDKAFENQSDALNLCIIGNNPFNSILSKLESKKIDSHPLKVYYLEEADQSSLQRCHLAYYTDTTQSLKTEAWQSSLDNTVSISDEEGFALTGGEIEFVLKGNRLNFIINNSSMKKKGIQPRASLLELAAYIL